MNVKLIALSLMLVVLLVAGCTAFNQQNEVSGIDSGNQAIDELVNDYSDNITDIDLGEMI